MISTLNFNLQLAVGGFAFLICVIIYPLYIRWLKAKQVEQFIREEGPQSHATKAKTPTMGGLCFVFGSCLTVSIMLMLVLPDYLGTTRRVYLLLPLVVGLVCSAIGFADDYGKVTSKSNRGLSAKLRLLIELALGLAVGATFMLVPDVTPALLLPDLQGQVATVPLADNSSPLTLLYYLVLCPLVVAGASNSVNLHDGMDGLAAGTSAVVFACLTYMMWLTGTFGLACICAAVCGSLLAFLCFNRYPAKVFMGDTGSLFIGGILAALSIQSGLTFWLIPLGLIYIVEAFSVMAQVVYFKLTKPYTGEPMPPVKLLITKLTKRLPGEGKRLFRMAPIHHHFEAVYAEKGVKEWEVVLWFWLVQLGLCAVVLLFFKPVVPAL